MRIFIRALILLPLILALAPAQDATRAEPIHYRLAFENDKVQVVYIHYGPHEKSKEHSHPPGVVVSITDAHLLFTDPDGKSREVYSKSGEARWFPALRHTVENIGDNDYSGVYIGMKGSTSAGGAEQPGMDEQSKDIIALYIRGMDSDHP
jgi:quercetin dioxygenase-like cupin family protein